MESPAIVGFYSNIVVIYILIDKQPFNADIMFEKEGNLAEEKERRVEKVVD